MFERVIDLLQECRTLYHKRNDEHGEMFEIPLHDVIDGHDLRLELLHALILLKVYRAKSDKTHRSRHDSIVDAICYLAMLAAVEAEIEYPPEE